MDFLVYLVLAVIIGSIVLSAWKQISMSVVASIACVTVMMVIVVDSQRLVTGDYSSDLFYNLAISPTDLAHPSMYYTLLTSMYTHASFSHIFFNVFVLVLLGAVFEARIGMRPFIVLYLLSGLAGTLLFAALHWGDTVHVVGASGAIMGILGGFARLYPTDKVSIFVSPEILSRVPLTMR
jgi:membrane associated rhomboid family serine protease